MEYVTLKVSELSGAALDWAVAKAWQPVYSDKHLLVHTKDFHPSTDWAQGGPIIEREELSRLICYNHNEWGCLNGDIFCDGPTPLVAAMRCYVASKLGDEVDIPLPLIG
jgi:hypothetical protein